MASLDIAWDITRFYEGEWTDYNHKLTDKTDDGNYFPFGKNFRVNYVGTNYGFTAAFGFDYIKGWQGKSAYDLHKMMKNKPESEVKYIFGGLKWEWCQGDKIENQSIANLLFDFTIMADQRMVASVAKVLDKSLSEVAQVKKLTTRKTTDGYRVLND